MEADRLRIVKSLLRLGAYLQREGDRLLDSYGLTHQQFVLMREIEEKGPLSQRDICSGLFFEKSNVSKIVKRLQSRGLVTRTASPDDGRVGLLSVTGRGRRVIGLSMARLEVWNRRWLRPLSESDVVEAVGVLGRLEGMEKTLKP